MSRTANAAAKAPRGTIDLSLSDGAYGLVGRKGAGKSTLLNLIAGRVGAPLVSGSCTTSDPVRLLDQSPDP
ncbi:ATP-binding cassette domain-containing protein [Celeribacter sp.]|uniref:ATP-binding cassette domain-containing protein n=1 Tax=Celeribacter sp. TaxID=1890673 RepID=UPI003A9211DC